MPAGVETKTSSQNSLHKKVRKPSFSVLVVETLDPLSAKAHTNLLNDLTEFSYNEVVFRCDIAAALAQLLVEC